MLQGISVFNFFFSLHATLLYIIYSDTGTGAQEKFLSVTAVCSCRQGLVLHAFGGAPNFGGGMCARLAHARYARVVPEGHQEEVFPTPNRDASTPLRPKRRRRYNT